MNFDPNTLHSLTIAKRTPLHVAASFDHGGSVSILELLLHHYSPHSRAHDSSFSPHEAKENDDESKEADEQALPNGKDNDMFMATSINTTDVHGLNALHVATKNGHIKNVITLVACKQCDLYAVTDTGMNALHIAGRSFQIE